MQRLVLIMLPLLLLIGSFVATPARLQSQVPQNACDLPVATADGGDTIQLSTIGITLPVGYIYRWMPVVISPNGVHIRICITQFDSEIVINATSKLETERTVNNPAAGPVLDQIAANAQNRPTAPIPTPTTVPTAVPTLPPAATTAPPPTSSASNTQAASTSTSSIKPPNTGDAGLR